MSQSQNYPGSIPARAGEPPRRARRRGRHGVYPRACGGTLVILACIGAFAGLSPRVRGNPNRFCRTSRSRRSIPARAGEPPSYGAGGSISWVYPRACGGTQLGEPDGIRPDGSIPARAGEPKCPQTRLNSFKVYPRACGGTSPREMRRNPFKGLSPRVRGNLSPRPKSRCHRRSIPARAGEPHPPSVLSSAFRVYPRACGGTRSHPRQ